MHSIMFYVFAIIAIFGSIIVITARNPVHSVLFLVLVFCNVAGLFLLLGAEFLAMILVIVYAGAVAVLFLFVIMMLNINIVPFREGFLSYLPIGGLIGMILFAELVMVAAGWVFAPNMPAGNLLATTTHGIPNTEALGQVLYTRYIYQFQTAGIALLVAMIGAILLTLRSRSGVRRQSVARQLVRTKANSLELKKVPTRGGV